MVKCLAPPLSRGDSYVQVLLNSALTNKLTKATGSEAGIKGYVLGTGFTRYNAVYLKLTPLINDPIIPHLHLNQDKTAIKKSHPD